MRRDALTRPTRGFERSREIWIFEAAEWPAHARADWHGCLDVGCLEAREEWILTCIAKIEQGMLVVASAWIRMYDSAIAYAFMDASLRLALTGTERARAQ